jgi:hypothetical protein
VVVYGEPQALSAAQIPLGCFHRNMPQEELDLLKFPAGSMADLAQVRRQSCRDNLGMPATTARRFTTCQITFSVMPPPHTEPCLLTQRNTRPPVTCADITHTSTAAFTQSGAGTVRIWPPCPPSRRLPSAPPFAGGAPS